MYFAIGVPAGPVRIYIMSDLADAQNQCRDGEVAVPSMVSKAGATISADGTSVTPPESE